MKKLAKIIIAVITILLLLVMWLFFNILRTGSEDSAQKADAIAVLGAAQYAGKPSPVLKARLDHALELFQKNLAPLVITTGGNFAGEKFTEGEVGKKYLQNKGIPEDKIISENNSQTTEQNIAGIAQIAKEKKLAKIILVSDPFHMYRSSLIAKNSGLIIFTSPTLTSPISKNAWLRFWYIGREIILTSAYLFFRT